MNAVHACVKHWQHCLTQCMGPCAVSALSALAIMLWRCLSAASPAETCNIVHLVVRQTAMLSCCLALLCKSAAELSLLLLLMPSPPPALPPPSLLPLPPLLLLLPPGSACLVAHGLQ